jgi:Cu(I)/Ag(I) efflux system membrane fusion protein
MNDTQNPVPPPAPPAHEVPPGAPFMNVVRWVLFAGLLLLAAIAIGSYVTSRRSSKQTSETKQALYHCPMHPSYTSDRPGECPICGMNLEKIPGATAAGPSGNDGNVPGLATVELSPERIQMIGVRTTVVERRALGGGLELVGFVTPDESRIHRIQLRVSGYVQRIHGGNTGGMVRAGQPLLSLYSPELYQSEQEFLIETGLRDTMPHGAPRMQHDDPAAARRRLELLGVPAPEIARLERERKASSNLTLTSPASGTVLERMVSDGQSVSPDTPLFTIADLRRVWVLADLYEMDVARLRSGARAEFSADAIPGRTFAGRVDMVYPTVSSETRTVKARVALDNPSGALRPGMFGKVRVSGSATPVLVVPTEAVVDAGEHRYVFLAHAGGRFEPREVTTGATSRDGVEVRTGLAAGDTVVSSASFLIDSESRLKAAIAGMSAQPAQPHSGAKH